MAGRPRKLSANSTGNTSKEFKEQRKREEEKLERFEKISLLPPEWLNADGKEEYLRVAPLMDQLPIAALDYATLTMYCDFFAKYKAASILVAEEGTTISETDDTGKVINRKNNPEYGAMLEAARMVRSLAGNLGLTIDSRLKIVVPEVTKEKDDFKGLL